MRYWVKNKYRLFNRQEPVHFMHFLTKKVKKNTEHKQVLLLGPIHLEPDSFL